MEKVEDKVGAGIVVRTTELASGDFITEADTPQGPWYEVTRTTDKSFRIDDVRFVKHHNAVVLRRGEN